MINNKKYLVISFYNFMIAGFVAGFFVSVYYIVLNHYVPLRMYRLVAIVFQKNLNNNILFFLAIFIILILIWYLFQFIFKGSRTEFLFLVSLLCFMVLGNFLSISVLGYPLIEKINRFFIIFGLFIKKEINIVSFITKVYLPLLLLLGLFLVALVAFWLLKKIDVERFFLKFKLESLRRLFLFGVGILATLNIGIFLDSHVKKPEGANVIIVVSDALRKDHLSCYGYHRNTTPNIDKFTDTAIVFNNAFAQSPSTKPSIASLFTSLYVSQHNVVYNDNALNNSFLTLSEIFRQNKYSTAGFIENPLLSKKFKFHQGFDVWKLDDRRHKETLDSMEDFDTKIFSWLKGHLKKRFLLYIHYIDPHSPYMAPEDFSDYFDSLYKGKIKGTSEELKNPELYFSDKRDLDHLVSLYDDEIRYVDWRFGKLIDRLNRLGILEKSIVVFLSDHGEEFLDHGRFFHSNSVYAELINIPLIVKLPNSLKNINNKKHVQHIDILPSLLSFLGFKTKWITLEGRNIFTDSHNRGPIAVFSEHIREEWGVLQRCIISGVWKLIHNINSNTFSLFNIFEDPIDNRSVLKENIEVAKNLKSQLSDWYRNLNKAIKSSEVRLDTKTKEKLKSLGYIR